MAILGWEPAFLGHPNIGIGRLFLFGNDLTIGLCGAEELTRQADRNLLSRMVAIQSGRGSWTQQLRHLSPGIIVTDVSKFTTFHGHHGGVLPRLLTLRSYMKTFHALIGEFEKIRSNLTHRDSLVFFSARPGATGQLRS